MRSAGHPFPSPRRLSGSIYILVLLAVGIFCYQRSGELFLYCLGLAAISWWMVELRGWAVSRFVLNIAILGAFGYLVWEIYTTFLVQSVVISLARFVVAILMCKLFERRKPRDQAQLIMLSVVVTVSGLMFAPAEISFGALCIAYVCMLMYVVMVRVASANAHVEDPAQRVTPRTPRADTCFAGDVRRSVKRGMLVMVPVTLVLFLILPRPGASGFSDVWNTEKLQTGFSDVVSFRDVEELTPSDQVVMHVTLTRDGQNIGSELYQPYFRGQVIEDFYRTRQDARKVVPGSDTFQMMDHPHLDAGYIVEDYNVFVPPRAALFTTGTAGFVTSDQFSSVTLNLSTMILTHLGGFRPLRYKVVDPLKIGDDAFDFQTHRDAPAIYGELAKLESGVWPVEANALPSSLGQLRQPASDDIRKIIATIFPDLPPDGMVPRERVRSAAYTIETYLRTHYRYSLSTHQVDRSLDAITDFLVNRKEVGGYCEYFALGMVRLCQTVGIPAREVTGYYGGEFNSVGGYYIVRQRDAHMWVEYFSPDEGWVRADPTAATVAANPTASVLSRALRELIGWAQDCWLTFVVTFDNDSRRRLWGLFAGLFTDPGSRANWLTWVSILLVIVTSTSVVPVLRRWPVLSWMRSPRIGRRRQNVSLAAAEVSGGPSFLGELMATLGRISPRRKDMTPREFVDALSLGAAGPDARWIVQTAYAALWGGRPIDAALQEQITLVMGRVQAQLTIPITPPAQA